MEALGVECGRWPCWLTPCEASDALAQAKMLLGHLTAWAWDTLSDLTGRPRQDKADPVWFLVPPLTSAAEEYVARIASFWDDDVYWMTQSGQEIGENLWTPPIADILGGPVRSP